MNQPISEVPDSQRESYILHYRAAVLFCSRHSASPRCQNKDVTELCYNPVPWPKPWTFQAMPQKSAPGGTEEDALAKVIAMLPLPLGTSCVWGPGQMPAQVGMNASCCFNSIWHSETPGELISRLCNAKGNICVEKGKRNRLQFYISVPQLAGINKNCQRSQFYWKIWVILLL